MNTYSVKISYPEPAGPRAWYPTVERYHTIVGLRAHNTEEAEALARMHKPDARAVHVWLDAVETCKC
jgi:hypothetical protein